MTPRAGAASFNRLAARTDAADGEAEVRDLAPCQCLSGSGLFLYLRHADNAWRFACGSFLDPAGWQRAAEPDLPSSDRAFYAARPLRRRRRS